MAFAKIPQVPRSQELMRSSLSAARPKSMRKKPYDDALSASRKFERERLFAFREVVISRLAKLVTSFPSVDALSEFYRALLGTHFSLDDYKRVLGRVDSTKQVVSTLTKKYKGRVEAAGDVDEVKKAMSEYFGRVASVLTRLEESFIWLEEIRRLLEDLPVVKEMFTVCIAGFPNVGKSTLFQKITGSAAEVNSYAFTTKSLNVGSAKLEHYKVQFIDTPGTLNREYTNAIEDQAALALKYVADLIIFVYDPTEQYSEELQRGLRASLSDLRAPILEFVSKLDIASDEQAERFVSEKTVSDVDLLREEILACAKKYYTQL
ncbi:MAG: GTPase [Candidatus Woesearchaeota archaeon]